MLHETTSGPSPTTAPEPVVLNLSNPGVAILNDIGLGTPRQR